MIVLAVSLARPQPDIGIPRKAWRAFLGIEWSVEENGAVTSLTTENRYQWAQEEAWPHLRKASGGLIPFWSRKLEYLSIINHPLKQATWKQFV